VSDPLPSQSAQGSFQIRLAPIPELVLFTLRDIKGLGEGGPEEKERWSIYALFRETVMVFVMAKFGFEVEFAGHLSEVKAALGKLKKAVRAETMSAFGTGRKRQVRLTKDQQSVNNTARGDGNAEGRQR